MKYNGRSTRWLAHEHDSTADALLETGTQCRCCRTGNHTLKTWSMKHTRFTRNFFKRVETTHHLSSTTVVQKRFALAQSADGRAAMMMLTTSMILVHGCSASLGIHLATAYHSRFWYYW